MRVVIKLLKKDIKEECALHFQLNQVTVVRSKSSTPPLGANTL